MQKPPRRGLRSARIVSCCPSDQDDQGAGTNYGTKEPGRQGTRHNPSCLVPWSRGPMVVCLTFSHPDLPRSKSAGPRHVIGLSICRLGTGLTVGSGLAPDPPLPCIRQRVAGSSVLSERNYRRSGINHSSQYPVATDQHAASFALATGYCLLATRRSHPAPKVVLCGCQQQC